MNQATRRTRRLRIIRHCAALVCFGLFATVLIAWASAVLTPIGKRSSIVRNTATPSEWIEPVPKDWPEFADSFTHVAVSLNTVPYGLRRLMKQRPPGPGNPPRSTRLRIRQGFESGVSTGPNGIVFTGGDPLFVVDQIRYGWPINTMVTRGPDDARPQSGNAIIDVYQSGIVLSGSGTNALRALPLRPRWGAFLLSVLGWSLLAWMLLMVYTMTGRYRRRRWRMAGRCVGCGYAVEGLGVCPECGAGREE